MIESRSGRVLLRMPVSLHEYLVERARGESVSLNMFICSVVAGECGWSARNNAPLQSKQELRSDIAWEMWRDRARQ